MTASNLIDSIESYNFECEGGPLRCCDEWIQLKQLVAVWFPHDDVDRPVIKIVDGK